MLILINNAYERVASIILSADNRWQWDDTNNTTDFPIATTNLVSGQADYTLATTHLRILRVESSINAAGTVFQKLELYDQQDEDESLTYRATISGIPYRYDELGASVILDPKPNFSCTSGLKVYFQRGPTNFTSGEVSTGTKLPGFNSLYHDLIPLHVAYEYWLVNDPNMTTRIMDQINLKENALKKDYISRNNNDHKRLSMGEISFK